MKFLTYEDFQREEAVAESFDLKSLERILHEGMSAYRLGIRVSKAPYAGSEGGFWRMGWLIAWQKGGQPRHRLSTEETNALAIEQEARRRFNAEHTAKDSEVALKAADYLVKGIE